MREKLSLRLVESARPKTAAYDIRDSGLTGFLLRVNPSGKKVYYVQFDRGKRYRIGPANLWTPTQARNKAHEILAGYARGVDPNTRKPKVVTLREFVDKDYGPWITVHRKSYKKMLWRLNHVFAEFMPKPLGDINAWVIEKWRSQRLKAGIKPDTANRDLAVLRACLSKAVEWEVLTAHPLAKLKPLKVDGNGRVRFLSADEEKALRAALDTREQRIRKARQSANEWRRERGYTEQAELGAFADHLKPLVLVALNTGLRRGELLSLTWADISFSLNVLTVGGDRAKSGKTRHVPLNTEAAEVLRQWQKQSGGDLVFPGKSGARMDNFKKAWAAAIKLSGIDGFTFHDLRHTFASKLVMAGVDLNTVRELLGHGDIKMTLRYAHLAPDHKAAAVAKLGVA